VYFGDGCFWHTQYDIYTVEIAAPFNRSLSEITTRVGYAGGALIDEVCYAGGPTGTFYGNPNGHGHAEAAQVLLDQDHLVAREQFRALVDKYFEAFRLSSGRDGPFWERMDPQDGGPDYRNVVGIPGGVNGALFPVLVAQNVHGMPLVEGVGGHVADGDTLDEGTVYVYDTARFPFFRAEQYHQFHDNWVLQRDLPPAYYTARDAAISRGWINPTCGESGDESNGASNVEDIRIVGCGCGFRLAATAALPSVLPVPGPESTMDEKPSGYGSCVAEAQQNLRWGADRTLANSIGCNNRYGAEPGGYFQGTTFVQDQQGEPTTIFYDSVTGKPLFQAPINRTWAEFLAESEHHGWPSFRDEEVFWENVRVVDASGETVSVDGTHLGHNLPDAAQPDRNRYCIDLVSIAGQPAQGIGEVGLNTCCSVGNTVGGKSIESSKHAYGDSDGGMSVGAIVAVIAVSLVGIVLAGAYVKYRTNLLSSHAVYSVLGGKKQSAYDYGMVNEAFEQSDDDDDAMIEMPAEMTVNSLQG
jgi:peptide methionine sulfoxide reductase MsrB/peptide methionine sulfoxide reductase MsrA